MQRLWGLLLLAVLLCGNIEDGENLSTEHTITIDSVGTNLRFVPDSLTINEGDSVRFLWDGEVLPHNAVEQNNVFNSGDPQRDVDYSYTFDFNQSGVYDFFCEPHESAGMNGIITVNDVLQNTDQVIITNSEVDNSPNYLFIFTVLLFLIFIGVRVRIDEPLKL